MKRWMMLLAGVLLCSSAYAANGLAVNNAAALGGTTNGLEVSMDDADSTWVYVQSDEPNGETTFTVDWRMNLMPAVSNSEVANRYFRFMTWNETGQGGRKVFFAQRQNLADGGNWRLAVWSYDTDIADYKYAGGTFLAGYGGDVDVHVRCEWTQETTNGSCDGTLSCYRAAGSADLGAPKFTTSDLCDDGTVIDNSRFGFIDLDGFPESGNDGSFYLDEYASYR